MSRAGRAQRRTGPEDVAAARTYDKIEDPITANQKYRIIGALYAGGMTLGNRLQEELFERRIVLVTGRLDDDAAAKAAAALLSLDARADRPIELHLDSSD